MAVLREGVRVVLHGDAFEPAAQSIAAVAHSLYICAATVIQHLAPSYDGCVVTDMHGSQNHVDVPGSRLAAVRRLYILQTGGAMEMFMIKTGFYDK